MSKLLAPLLGAFLLFGCAATPAPAPKAAEAPAAPVCTTATVERGKEIAVNQGLTFKAEYTGKRLKEFLVYMQQFSEPTHMTETADQVLVFRGGPEDRYGLILFFKDDCALGHMAGPWDAIEPFVGQSA